MGRSLLCAIAILVFSFAIPANAEHRVFTLTITNTTTGQSRNVTSTLDDIQYPSYHPISKDETIAIADSWMCWERSDISQDITQKLCPSPRAPASTAPKTPTAK
jgi:hypothetical protein